MIASNRRNGILFLLWAVVACPAIGVSSWLLADTDSEAIIFTLLVGLPGALAVIGGVALRQGLERLALGIVFAGGVGFLVAVVLATHFAAEW